VGSRRKRNLSGVFRWGKISYIQWGGEAKNPEKRGKVVERDVFLGGKGKKKRSTHTGKKKKGQAGFTRGPKNRQFCAANKGKKEKERAHPVQKRRFQKKGMGENGAGGKKNEEGEGRFMGGKPSVSLLIGGGKEELIFWVEGKEKAVMKLRGR